MKGHGVAAACLGDLISDSMSCAPQVEGWGGGRFSPFSEIGVQCLRWRPGLVLSGTGC